MKSEWTQEEEPRPAARGHGLRHWGKLTHLEDFVGLRRRVLCGIAISQVLAEGPAREKLRFLGKQLFICGSFVVVGIRD